MCIDLTSASGRFALGEAFHAVRRLVWRFDFARESHGANYAGIPDPYELTEVINGFLAEREHLLAGDVRDLERAKVALQEQISRAYQAGRQSAHQQWANATAGEQKELSTVTPETVVNKAWKEVPKGLPQGEANWFVEGFCRDWWMVEYVTYIRGTG